MQSTYQKLSICYESVRQKTDFVPEVALVLGSGLGDYADEIKVVSEINYQDIEKFPISTVSGHSGKLIFGYINNVAVVCMKGRIHYYEGYPMSDVVLPIRLMKLLGARILLLTNACGGLHLDYQPGDLMIIKDHISCFIPNPLIGPNIDQLGVRFPDMTNIYDLELQESIKMSANNINVLLKEGVYVQYSGPSYETPTEIKMFASLGADVVGMSTVVEAIVGHHSGMRVCGISCITNLAAGLLPIKLTHEEVQNAASKVAPKFKALLNETITNFRYVM